MGVVPRIASFAKASTALALVWTCAACVRLVTPLQEDPAPTLVTPLGLGQGCTADATCASGHCVDGVCCSNECQGTCATCAQPGSLGRCVSAQDNTDPRAECDGCFACFAGACAPSPAGSAPKDECGATQACNGLGVCAAGQGEACTLEGGGCASGACILSQCTHVREQRLPPAFDDATYERPLSVLQSAHGVALLTNPRVVSPYTAWDANGCPSVQALTSVDLLRFQVIRPEGIQQQVFDNQQAAYPAALVETSSGHEMVFARPCGATFCGLSTMAVPGGSAQPVMDTPRFPVWIAAVALPDGRTVVGTQGDAVADQVKLATRPGPESAWVTAGVGFRDGSYGGPQWAVALGRPWLVGVLKQAEPQLYAVTLDAAGQPTVVRSAVLAGCQGSTPMVSAVAVAGVVHVLAVCGVGSSSDVIHAVLQDAGTPGATFASSEVWPFEPPMSIDVAGVVLVARGTSLAVVFGQGPTLRVAWPDPAGIWRHQKVSQVGDGELDVGYFRGSQTGNNVVVAWTPGHVVYSAVVSSMCGESSLPLFHSWLALTHLTL